MRYKVFTLCGSATNDGLCMCCQKIRPCTEACRKICFGCEHEFECDQRTKIRAIERGWCFSREDRIEDDVVPDDMIALQLQTMSDNSE